ncbi:hypothetical protein EV702DRAFT_1282132 [Suillus placidus]|uniref:Uncharacterized protein n=1 Tax=Suillus placidus TaxID=48579 RepID=A0A9P6ZJV8_9AGAM|nr:hypothetical protein EV702DRAFT_1282132 [Suillus placidus]
MPTDGWTVVHDDEGQAFCRRVEIKELCLGVEHIDADTKEKRCCPDVSGLTWIDKPAQLAKCCAKGHVWTYDHGVGSAHGGCCPVGFHMSNGMCIPNITPPPPPHRCPTGTHLVDGQCVQIHGPCPQTCGNGLGGVEPSCTCTNNPVCGHGKYLGIKYGHCYILSFSDGHQLGIDRDSIWYKKDGFFVDIPFKVCNSTTDCSRGKEVEMGQSFSLQDQHGLYKDTKSTKGWINTPLKDGNHMEFTTDANTAAKFTGIPSCAGGECAIKMFGINGGAVSYACPMPDPGLTFYGNPKVGQKIRFSEVTCDEYEVPLTSGINLK